MAATEEVERVEALPVDSVVVEAEAVLVGQAVDMLAAVGTAEVANWAAAAAVVAMGTVVAVDQALEMVALEEKAASKVALVAVIVAMVSTVL